MWRGRLLERISFHVLAGSPHVCRGSKVHPPNLTFCLLSQCPGVRAAKDEQRETEFSSLERVGLHEWCSLFLVWHCSVEILRQNIFYPFLSLSKWSSGDDTLWCLFRDFEDRGNLEDPVRKWSTTLYSVMSKRSPVVKLWGSKTLGQKYNTLLKWTLLNLFL